METLTITLTVVLAGLLAAAFYLVLSAPKEKTAEEDGPPLVELKNYAKPAELEDDADADAARAEAEKEFVTPEPKYAETEEEFGKLEIHIRTASDMSAPRCLRLIAGIFIEGYGSYEFMNGFLKAMPEEESRNVLDAMEMARNPELYMDNHTECLSKCLNEKCPYSRKK